MRRVVADVAKERGVFVIYDEMQRFVRQHIADVSVGSFRLVAAKQSRVEIVVPVAAVESERLVKPLARWDERVLFTIVPLAHASGSVAGILQRLSDRDFAWLHRFAIVRDTVTARSKRPPTSQQCRSCRCAERVDKESLELHGRARQSVNVRSLEMRIPVNREVTITLVVRDDEQHVWLGLGFLRVTPSTIGSCQREDKCH